jgi:hypothetical protein
MKKRTSATAQWGPAMNPGLIPGLSATYTLFGMTAEDNDIEFLHAASDRRWGLITADGLSPDSRLGNEF